jgi:hypothetical protein
VKRADKNRSGNAVPPEGGGPSTPAAADLERRRESKSRGRRETPLQLTDPGGRKPRPGTEPRHGGAFSALPDTKPAAQPPAPDGIANLPAKRVRADARRRLIEQARIAELAQATLRAVEEAFALGRTDKAFRAAADSMAALTSTAAPATPLAQLASAGKVLATLSSQWANPVQRLTSAQECIREVVDLTRGVQILINYLADPKPSALRLLADLPKSVKDAMEAQAKECRTTLEERWRSGNGPFSAPEGLPPWQNDSGFWALEPLPEIEPLETRLMELIRTELGQIRKTLRESRDPGKPLDEAELRKVLGFLTRVDDPHACLIARSVMVEGNVARASRALKLPDATVRSRIETWKRRGGAYVGLYELVRWRCRQGPKGALPLDEGRVGATAAQADFPEIIAETVEALGEMNDRNWPELRAALIALLTPHNTP